MQYQLKRGANLGMSLLEKIEEVVSRERSNLSLSHRILLAVLRLLSLFMDLLCFFEIWPTDQARYQEKAAQTGDKYW